LAKEDLFRNPPKIFRGIPFWSINDFLNVDEAVKQIGLLDDAGFGGVFFHAREGLVTPFLGDDWFKVFEAVVKEAEKRGLTVWIYDEDRWPSGFAGGYVPALDSRYRAKSLVMIVDNKCYYGNDTIAMFRCIPDENGLPIKCERIYQSEQDPRYVYLTFVRYVAAIGDKWFSGFSYVDLLDEDVVKKFVEIAYRPYIEKFGNYIGSVIPGAFTDEPNITSSRPRAKPQPFSWVRGPRMLLYSLPWTDKLPEVFEKLNGYSVVDKLPELFFNIGSYRKTRYDFWKTVTLMFVNSFTKQVYEYCDRNGLRFTGHFLAEDDLVSQLVVGAVMPHYEYMHIPGIDHLAYQIWNSLLTVKQVASVANQLGKERVLCEAYGTLGNYPSFEDRKWIGDFLYALGVNLLNHHLVPYSMRGRRKADYGLNFHWSQPWWKYNRLIEDYYTRLSYVLSQGIRVVDVLIIHPMTSVWSVYTPVNDSEARKLNEMFMNLLKNMLKMHIDFELGDEMLLAKYGDVEQNMLKVGRARYKVVLVPPSINISSSTLALLKRFVESRGTLIVLEPKPTHVDGVENSEIQSIYSKAVVVKNLAELSNVLKSYLNEFEIVVESNDSQGNVIVHARRVEDKIMLFVVNVDRNSSYSVAIGVKGCYSVEEWDPFTGDIKAYPHDYRNERTYIEFTLKPVDSKLFAFKPSQSGYAKTEKSIASLHKVDEIKLSGEWIVRRRDKNVLVLDYAKLSIDNSEWSEFQPLPKIVDQLYSYGLGASYKVRFEFYVKSKPKPPLHLVIENPKQFRRVVVNGNQIDVNVDDGKWIDWNFRKYEISKYIVQGLNYIELEGVAGFEIEIEPLYILGDFGVVECSKGCSEIVDEKNKLVFNEEINVVKHGYPFYAGEMEFIKMFRIDRNDFDKAYLEIEKINAALAIIYVNGFEVSKAISSSLQIDITKYVRKGENELRILLVGTLRNVLGPLHREDPQFTSPLTFYIVDNTWRDDYVLKPFGFRNAKIAFYKESEKQ